MYVYVLTPFLGINKSLYVIIKKIIFIKFQITYTKIRITKYVHAGTHITGNKNTYVHSIKHKCLNTRQENASLNDFEKTINFFLNRLRACCISRFFFHFF